MTKPMSGLAVEVRRSIAIVRFNQPATRNSLSQQILTELEDALQRFAADNAVKAIIFTGTGEMFAAGADIRELQQLDARKASDFARRGQSVMTFIAAARATTLAAVNGYCMGGGLDLALACDIRLASTKAVFAHPGARLGIITGWGGTRRLPQIIGRARALEIFTTARQVKSEEAFEIGLVSGLHDPVLEYACEFAGRIGC